jgi:CheY-like chemotaxis protein
MACSVLVIEDDVELREMMLTLLRVEGFTPRAASNGEEALFLLQHEPAPHVILLDLMMPVMDGWHFRAIQKVTPPIADIPVVLVTAVPPRDAGDDAAAVFSKPVDFDRLLTTVRRLC